VVLVRARSLSFADEEHPAMRKAAMPHGGKKHPEPSPKASREHTPCDSSHTMG